MSEAIAFDTRRYVKRLMEGGFDERQAETLVPEQIAFLNANLATKSDIAKIEAGIETLRQETKAEIEGLRSETKLSIAEDKVSFMKWMLGAAMLAQTTVILAFIALFLTPPA
ncbi:MAG: hypothetical protein OXE48_05435 [Gammaproteobacteria bacterium]|nr:hypothetical protein [Gammaproteobacteria bacterium]MCY4340795.1 hypothetical protein [Gammaproteobacteria bacterium]